jgi:hypothetical protein
VRSEAKLAVETVGPFIDERYSPRAREHIGDDTAARLKEDFAAWFAEPLEKLSAWRIESWHRDQLDSVAQHPICRLCAVKLKQQPRAEV